MLESLYTHGEALPKQHVKLLLRTLHSGAWNRSSIATAAKVARVLFYYNEEFCKEGALERLQRKQLPAIWGETVQNYGAIPDFCIFPLRYRHCQATSASVTSMPFAIGFCFLDSRLNIVAVTDFLKGTNWNTLQKKAPDLLLPWKELFRQDRLVLIANEELCYSISEFMPGVRVELAPNKIIALMQRKVAQIKSFFSSISSIPTSLHIGCFVSMIFSLSLSV